MLDILNVKIAKLNVKIGAICLLTILGHVPVSAGLQSPPTPDFDRLVQAIYQAEGGPKARKPFGILSISCAGYQDCRHVCMNTVKNTWRRWQRAGNPGEFLDYLGSRYCPVPGDQTGLNRHWVGNVRRLYDQAH